MLGIGPKIRRYNKWTQIGADFALWRRLCQPPTIHRPLVQGPLQLSQSAVLGFICVNLRHLRTE